MARDDLALLDDFPALEAPQDQRVQAVLLVEDVHEASLDGLDDHHAAAESPRRFMASIIQSTKDRRKFPSPNWRTRSGWSARHPTVTPADVRDAADRLPIQAHAVSVSLRVSATVPRSPTVVRRRLRCCTE